MSTTTASPPPIGPLGGETYRLTLPGTASAARVARDFVTSLLVVSRHPGLVDDARLCVTEVVTNAHRHARTSLIGVHVTVDRELVTVAVSDDMPWTAPVAGSKPGGPLRGRAMEGGWGLFLLEELAAAWGSDVCGCCAPRHKTVWFTLTGKSDSAA